MNVPMNSASAFLNHCFRKMIAVRDRSAGLWARGYKR
jgi:hypothetical protein